MCNSACVVQFNGKFINKAEAKNISSGELLASVESELFCFQQGAFNCESNTCKLKALLCHWDTINAEEKA